MTEARSRPVPATEPYPGARIVVLGLLAVLMLVPVTLPVTVLRGLVAERFAVSELVGQYPWDPGPRAQRASLLEQVGLIEVAIHERRQIRRPSPVCMSANM